MLDDHLQQIRTSGVVPCERVKVFLNDEEVTVSRIIRLDQPFAFVKASLPEGKKVRVRIELDRLIHKATVDIHPTRLEIVPDRTNRSVEFELPEPRMAAAIISICAPIVLALDSISPEPTGEKILESDHAGLKSDPEADQTDALQRLLDQVAADPKRSTLSLAPGIYRSGRLTLRTGSSLHLQSGAVLQAIDDPQSFGTRRTTEMPDRPAFIRILEAEGSSLSGHGIIDANGVALRRNGLFGYCLYTLDSKNISIKQVTLMDSGGWNSQFCHSRGIDIENVTVLNNLPPERVLNTDGFDPDSSSDMTIRRCFIHCGDDAVVIKSSFYPERDGAGVENILVEDIISINNSAVFKIGTETTGPFMRNIKARNLDAIRAARGIVIEAFDVAEVSEITIEDVRVAAFVDAERDAVAAIELNVPLPGTVFRKAQGDGRIFNVTITGFVAGNRAPIIANGRNEDHGLKYVRISGINMAGASIPSRDNPYCRIGPYAEILLEK